METIEHLLIRHEGKVRHAYQDSLGYWTIGVGRLIDKRKGGGLSEGEIMFLLHGDIGECRRSLYREVPWWADLSPDRQSVLICMCFQMGITGLMKFKATLAAMEHGYYAIAAEHMLKSKWARQAPERVQELAAMMVAG